MCSGVFAGIGYSGYTNAEVITMKKKEEKVSCVRLNPEDRLCPEYDSCSIKLFSAPDREEMGVCVVDNFPEEHIQ